MSQYPCILKIYQFSPYIWFVLFFFIFSLDKLLQPENKARTTKASTKQKSLARSNGNSFFLSFLFSFLYTVFFLLSFFYFIKVKFSIYFVCVCVRVCLYIYLSGRCRPYGPANEFLTCVLSSNITRGMARIRSRLYIYINVVYLE